MTTMEDPGYDTRPAAPPPGAQIAPGAVDPFPRTVPTILTPGAPAEPAPAQRRPKAPSWYQKPHIVAVVVLSVLLAETIAFALLGPVWWAVANAALIALLFMAALAWRRRGKGGVLDKLLRGLGLDRRGRSGPGGGRSRHGGGPGWPFSGLGSRRRNGPGGGPGGGKGKGGFPNIFGGRKGQRPTAGGKQTPGGGGKWPSWRNRRSPGGGSGPGGGPGGGKSGPGGGKKRPGGGHRGGKANPLNWKNPFSDSGGKSNKKSDGGRDKKKRPEGEFPGGKANPLNWKSWRPFSDPNGERFITGKRDNKDSKGQASPPAPDVSGKPTESKAAPEPAPRHNRPSPQPNTNSAKGGTVTSAAGNIPYSEDSSVQRAGANLNYVHPAAAEVARLTALAEQAQAAFREQFGRSAAQWENEMPADGRMKAEVEGVNMQAKHATTADDWRRVAENAAALPKVYGNEHEVDELRLAGGRGGLHKERRADVTVASTDN